MQPKIDQKFIEDHGLITWGDFNVTPEPYKECDIKEFWRHVFHYGVRKSEYRQLRDNFPSFGEETPSYLSVHLFIYHDVIFMIHIDRRYEPKCWIVGCDHDYRDESDHYGNHRVTCINCGYSWEYDSSG